MTKLEHVLRASSLIKGCNVSLYADDSPQQCRPTIYDTAFVAMLSRQATSDGIVQLVYPETFQYLLDHQDIRGGWVMRNFTLGTILSSLAGLLAIVQRLKSLPAEAKDIATSLQLRVTKATDFLQGQFVIWDPKSNAHCCSIVLVPALLAMLRVQGIHLDCRGHAQLEKQRMEIQRTLESLSPECNGFSPALYYLECHMETAKSLSLEANISHHGISCSPSSTAAFLLGTRTSARNEECEAYLSAAIKATGTRGGVPSLFPPNNIEAAYSIEVLFESSLLDTTEIADPVQVINRKWVDRTRYPSMHTSEIMDLSTRLLIHKLSGTSSDSQLRDHLEILLCSSSNACNMSFEEGCRILKTLLRSPNMNQSNLTISSVFEKICSCWWIGKEGTTLSRSPLYAIMLFAECLAKILELLPNMPLTIVRTEDILKRGPIILIQMLAKILSSQNSDGSWGPPHCSETTSYAILALIAMTTHPHLQPLNLEIRHAIERGRQTLSLMRSSWVKSHSLWIGKTAFGSDRLSEAFSLAALHKPYEFPGYSENSSVPMDMQAQKALGLASFFHGLDNLFKEPMFKIKAGALESVIYVSMLRSIREDVFPPTAATENDKYLDYIPIMWTIHSIVRGIFAPPQLIWDTSVLSMFIFLVDEYMESKVVSFTQEEFSTFRKGIEEMFAVKYPSLRDVGGRISLIDEQCDFSTIKSLNDKITATSPRQLPNVIPANQMKKAMLLIRSVDLSSVHSDRVRDALSIFGRWARYHMNYESVVKASAMDLLDLRMETRNYLLNHVHQLEDNQRLAKQPHLSSHLQFSTPRMGFAPWLHSVGSGHIGAPIGLVFFACVAGSLVRGEGKDCFGSVRQKIMAWDCNTHAGKQLRMYNDYGSVARDAEEDNLSCLNFPEFFGDGDDARVDSTGEFDAKFRLMLAKQVLLEAAEYERRHTNEELVELYGELNREGAEGSKIADWLGVYYAGGDQFSDMYLVRDVTNGTKQVL